MAFEVLTVLVLMVLNGVFAAAEIAVLSVRKTRVAQLAEEGRAGAKAVQWLRAQPERFLATVQIGLTVIGTTAAAFGGEALAHEFSVALGRLPVVGPHAARLGLVVVIAGISFLEIVVGELVPKSLALRAAERYSLVLGPLLRALATVVRPLVWMLTATSNAVLRLVGDRTSFTEARLSPEEIQELVEEAARVGSLDKDTSDLASRAIGFRDLRAVDVMVPRSDIVLAPKNVTAVEFDALTRGGLYSRVPVFEGSQENVVGYLALGDVLGPALRGEPFSVERHLRPIKFTPEVKRAIDLLRELQSERAPLAVVVDETGSVVGLVSIEDLVEELVGDILTENEGAAVRVQRDPDGTFLVPGSLGLHEVQRSVGVDLPESEQYATLAGLCIALAGRIPRAGESLAVPGGAVLEIVEANARRVKMVRVRKPTPVATED
jgi:putative hemolysin